MSNRNPSSPKISCFRSLHRLSSNNSENTSHRHLPLTGTGHCNSRLSENIYFVRCNQAFQNYNFFSKSNILIIWNLGTFNAHHFLMREQFMCADCYTGRLTFTNIILHKNNIRKGECVPEV